MKTNDGNDTPAKSGEARSDSNWGLWLFRTTLVATFLYSWWLLIYSHGIVPHHQ